MASKSGDWGGGFFAALFIEEHVLGGAGVEGRVKVDEVCAFRCHMRPEDSEVAAEEELVFPIHFREE